MAISDEIREQTVKLKDMDNKQRAEYIWHYYKVWILGTIFMIIVIISLVRSVIANSKPVYLDAMFLNAEVGNNSSAITLAGDFAKEYGIDTEEYKLAFDYVTYLDNDYGNQSSMAGQVKLIAKYQAEECDIVCGPESTMLNSADVGGYYRIDELLTEEKIESLKNKGYDLFYYTEKIYDEDADPDSDGNLPYTDGETYPAGFYIDNCSKLKEQGENGIIVPVPDDRYVLTVAYNTTKPEHAAEFIDFLLK